MADDEPTFHIHDTAVAHPLRWALILSYLPAFALLIAHGSLSHRVVPAIGLLPLSFSVASAIFTYRIRSSKQQDEEADHDEDATTTPRERFRIAITHPLTIFALDILLAASLMIVLVFTWTSHTRSASLSMLAAYATIPLLIGFFTHLYLASVALYEGFAIHGLVQWTAWRAVPPDCPNCNVRLRPDLPALPWLKYFQRRRSPDYAPVLANDEEPYRDEVESADGVAQPEAVDVRKKDKKGKAATPEPSGESTPWDA
ncbi:unnamed protein product [Clonostachys rosea f. rosea IK726]|uniref:Uncharacterized protein n=1 Tax=Clonostachys rosea f. rosea IK726 TaxID=1349383 RepID=A0ACA9UPN0_BIOOC|nr:unnamed protein product [Clonostachys rosea f. rosea IK726]